MGNTAPIHVFTYAYITTGDLAEETISVRAVDEAEAFAKARALVDQVSRHIGLKLVDCQPTKMRRAS